MGVIPSFITRVSWALPFNQRLRRDGIELEPAATQIAASQLDDQAAKDRLAPIAASAGPTAVRFVRARIAVKPSDYLSNRVERLLEAVVRDAPVASVTPLQRELFQREEEIGRMPLVRGFGELVALEPRLSEIDDLLRAGEDIEQGYPSRNPVYRRMVDLVGPDAHRDDEPILRSLLAQRVVYWYAKLTASGTLSDGLSYFDCAHFPLRQMSGVLVGRRADPPNPDATRSRHT